MIIRPTVAMAKFVTPDGLRHGEAKRTIDVVNGAPATVGVEVGASSATSTGRENLTMLLEHSLAGRKDLFRRQRHFGQLATKRMIVPRRRVPLGAVARILTSEGR